MKNISAALIGSFILLLISTSCSNNSKTTEMKTIENTSENSIFPRGERGSSDWFTGEVYVQGLVNPDEIENLYAVGSVTFEPGGKTNWHTHPIGQVLLVTEGEGFYQERGKSAQELRKGSVVVIPKDVEHWHGASRDNKLVHIAISNIKNGSPVTWLAPVSEQEYNSCHTEK